MDNYQYESIAAEALCRALNFRELRQWSVKVRTDPNFKRTWMNWVGHATLTTRMAGETVTEVVEVQMSATTPGTDAVCFSKSSGIYGRVGPAIAYALLWERSARHVIETEGAPCRV